jgi:hypothetical protein
MRGVHGDRSARFTALDGESPELTTQGSDFTNPVIDGKIPLTKIGALQSIEWPARSEVWRSEFVEG